MPDVFISYSRKDSTEAMQLVELLQSAGISCWIDRHGIDPATNWSKEIVQAIDESTAFVILLSGSSNVSLNVHKEVWLAAEKKKKILPIELEPVQISEDLQYHLAGLQRAQVTNIDSVIRALSKLGLEATSAPSAPTIVRQTDDRKSLMILPFEDLSPTADHGWFADGIVSELITALSNVKALRVTDAQTTKSFKSYKGTLTAYAREMTVRYFVQGDVRKFGDNIKISARLLDIETGDHLWQDALKGTIQDVFDIQELVAQRVVEGLNVLLTSEESRRLTEHGTSNMEAYELRMRATEYFERNTKDNIERALVLFSEAAELDPNFVEAHAQIANASQALYLYYSRDTALLDRAEKAAARMRELEGETAHYYYMMSRITLQRGDPAGARAFAEKSIEIQPDFASAYDALGFAAQAVGDTATEVSAWAKFAELRANNRAAYFNLLVALHEAGAEYSSDLQAAVDLAVPLFRRHIRLNPDDYNARVELATIFVIAGDMEDAASEAEELSKVESLDGVACYNLACIYLHAKDNTRAMAMLRRAVARGYSNRENLLRDPDLAPLRETPEFEEIMRAL